MHRIDADAHVSNMFDEGDPTVPRQPTQVDADWLNAVQEELAGLVEAAAISLVKGTNTQLQSAIDKLTLKPGSESLPSYGRDLLNGLLLIGGEDVTASDNGKPRVIFKKSLSDDQSEIWLTINAAWNNAEGHWEKDKDDAPAAAVMIWANTAAPAAGVNLYKQEGAGPFSDFFAAPVRVVEPMLVGYSNVGGDYRNVGYYQTPDGLVHLHGTFEGSGPGLAIFTLPEEFWPSGVRSFPVTSLNAGSNVVFGCVTIALDGTVSLVAGDVGPHSLDGIHYLP